MTWPTVAESPDGVGSFRTWLCHYRPRKPPGQRPVERFDAARLGSQRVLNRADSRIARWNPPAATAAAPKSVDEFPVFLSRSLRLASHKRSSDASGNSPPFEDSITASTAPANYGDSHPPTGPGFAAERPWAHRLDRAAGTVRRRRSARQRHWARGSAGASMLLELGFKLLTECVRRGRLSSVLLDRRVDHLGKHGRAARSQMQSNRRGWRRHDDHRGQRGVFELRSWLGSVP